MARGRARPVVVDANVLINLTRIERLDLLGSNPAYEFVVPEEVVAEVTAPAQADRLAAALQDEVLRRIESTELAEIEDAAELRRALGKGEAACLAIAHARGWMLASHERGRFLREARARLGSGRLLNTPGLFVLAIRAGVLTIAEADALTIAEADALKKTLERNRFKMRFASFRDIIGDE